MRRLGKTGRRSIECVYVCVCVWPDCRTDRTSSAPLQLKTTTTRAIRLMNRFGCVCMCALLSRLLLFGSAPDPFNALSPISQPERRKISGWTSHARQVHVIVIRCRPAWTLGEHTAHTPPHTPTRMRIVHTSHHECEHAAEIVRRRERDQQRPPVSSGCV